MTEQNPLYTLGQIFRFIWPEGPPANILDAVLVKPASGLAMAIKTEAGMQAGQDELAFLIDKLPADLTDPHGGVKIEDQGPFWAGFYHYLTAMDHAKQFGPEQLASAGKALFGKQWQTDLSRALGLSDARRVRQWMAGERPIPAGIWSDIAGLLRQRNIYISSVLGELTRQS